MAKISIYTKKEVEALLVPIYPSVEIYTHDNELRIRSLIFFKYKNEEYFTFVQRTKLLSKGNVKEAGGTLIISTLFELADEMKNDYDKFQDEQYVKKEIKSKYRNISKIVD